MKFGVGKLRESFRANIHLAHGRPQVTRTLHIAFIVGKDTPLCRQLYSYRELQSNKIIHLL